MYRNANSYAKSITNAITDAVYEKVMDKETIKQPFKLTSKDLLFKIRTVCFAISWISGKDVSTHSKIKKFR